MTHRPEADRARPRSRETGRDRSTGVPGAKSSAIVDMHKSAKSSAVVGVGSRAKRKVRFRRPTRLGRRKSPLDRT